jgi:enterochelin esterase-like enzyme
MEIYSSRQRDKVLKLAQFPNRLGTAALFLPFFFVTGIISMFSQENPPVPSPQVSADGRVTFRFSSPKARQVAVDLEGAPHPVPMQRGERGVWSVTVGPLEPDFYGYSFVADDVALPDPSNPTTRPNLLELASEVHVPGPASLPWEINDVPHGVVHHHFYRSPVVGEETDFYVYTPPGYDEQAKPPYPVLYLLHGYSDDASAWTAVGRANVILDNLLAQGKAKPMIVVMPLGYGAPEILSRRWQGLSDASLRQRNYEKFRDMLLQELIPAVERQYRVSKKPEFRSISGLSMGGAESLLVGLNHLDRFAWIGAFSSGGLGDDYQKLFSNINSRTNPQPLLLWISCGKEDRLFEGNEKLRNWLQSKDVRLTWVETPGGHSWMVWRRNLAALVPLLFKQK